MLTLDKVYRASRVLKDVIRETDMILAPNISPKANVYLKTENLQVTGSFKIRGSYFKISQLSDEEKAHGVIACSAGNHAQGVALAATKNGIKSLICLPAGAPISKVEATKRFGAEVCMVKGVYDDAYQKAIELKEEKGYTFIHPFDDEDVIAGQGTIGLEIMEQLPNADVVVVPIGGGGLMDGQIETLTKVQTIADGIAVKTPGDNTYDICRNYVDGVVTVTDDEISAAILTLLEQQKLIAEGAGAVPVAAVLFDKLPEDITGKNVCCLVSGGNIDVTILSRVIERGLKMGGRTANITIALSDKPGQLAGVSAIVADLGANVVSVNYDSTDLDMNITDCYLRIAVETRDFDHIAAIKKALLDAGFEVCD